MMEAEVLLYYQMPPEHPAVGALVDWSPICDRCAPVRVTGSCYRALNAGRRCGLCVRDIFRDKLKIDLYTRHT